METTLSGNKWVISLKPRYIKAFKEGTKQFEIRTRVPNALQPGDVLYVAESGSGGQVKLWLRVERRLFTEKTMAWLFYHNKLGVSLEEYCSYTEGRGMVYFLKISEVGVMPEGVSVNEFGLGRPPTWFAKVKEGSRWLKN